jgi:hypothetical protein
MYGCLEVSAFTNRKKVGKINPFKIFGSFFENIVIGMSFIFLSLLELAVIGHLVKDEGNIKKKPPVMCKKRVRICGLLINTQNISRLLLSN